MDPLANLLLVAFLVQSGEAAQDFDAGLLGDGEADVVVLGQIADFVEVVFEIQVGPTIGLGHGFIYLPMQVTQLVDSSISFVGIMKTVVELGQPNSFILHYVSTEEMIRIPQPPKTRLHARIRKGESLKDVRRSVALCRAFN